ncbi:MAG TPA: hypothetical protein VL309_02010 [Vicinamibacterales bacterium]|jgi:hypothetical protein|nr:hypothetical protein [Vicinamibacterales bacterium]
MLRSSAVGLATIALAVALAARAPEGADAAFQRFWDARSPQDAARAIDGILKSGIGFDEAYARLKAGRRYRPDVQRGEFVRERRTPRGDFFYTVDVPERYDPARRWPVRLQLHGGVMMRENGEPRSGRGSASSRVLRGAEQIYVLPSSWRDAPWWSDVQVENLRTILDALERTYNIDENRIALSGISDGATAAYYVAMRDTTPYASFEPLNGYLKVLANPALDIAGELYPNNLLNKPFFAINGALDPLYPAASVAPYMEHLQRAGVDVEFHARVDGVHNTAWWPDVKDRFEQFVADHPRAPLPDRLTWETDRTEGRNRAHWLVIDRLAARAPAAALPDVNLVPNGVGAGRPLFAHARPSGRVDLVRSGNRVEAAARGVAAFTLLVSPEAFDLDRPLQVVVNGKVVFEGRVARSLATLLKWAAADNDRTMLFAAEVRITIDG